MNNINLSNLKNNNLVYYIYQIDLSIYGIKDTPKFLIVGDKEFVENNSLESKDFPFIYTTEEWFSMVEHGEILPWICACLNKKFIHKEFVKLMMTTNPAQLRKIIDQQFNDIMSSWDITSKDSLFSLIANTIFAVQIIENHKIVNFNSVSKYYPYLENISLDKFKELYFPIQSQLYDLTNGILLSEKMARIKAILEAEELENSKKEENAEESKENIEQNGEV